ncbi:MAG: hypothetical protein LBG74_04345 [Spirochaetaceae bacterium]|jgi:hypothetical protein|nr:hypothetical protein [Spirochaetaceae bacterium]
MKKLCLLLAAACAAFVFVACQDVLFDEEDAGTENAKTGGASGTAVTGITLDKVTEALSLDAIGGGGGILPCNFKQH